MTKLYHQSPDPALTKVCAVCQIEKSLNDFYRVGGRDKNYRTECKACTLTQQHKRRFQKRNAERTQLPLFIDFRVCTKCHIEKPLDQFPINRNMRYGTLARCKACIVIENLERAQRILAGPLPVSKLCGRCKIEKPLEQFPVSKGYGRYGRASVCYECTQRRWQENKEKYTATNAKWRKANPLKDLRRSQGYTARKKKATTIDPVDYERILERDGMWCYICEQAILPGQKMHFDHVIPLARGGSHTEDNIKPTHLVCNVRKQDKLLSEMTAYQRRGPG